MVKASFEGTVSGFSKVVFAALLSLGAIVVASQQAAADVAPQVTVEAPESQSQARQGVFAPTTGSSSLASASAYAGLSLVGLTLGGILRSRRMRLRRAGALLPASRSPRAGLATVRGVANSFFQPLARPGQPTAHARLSSVLKEE